MLEDYVSKLATHRLLPTVANAPVLGSLNVLGSTLYCYHNREYTTSEAASHFTHSQRAQEHQRVLKTAYTCTVVHSRSPTMRSIPLV